MSVELGMMVYKGTVYLMESDSTKSTRKSKSPVPAPTTETDTQAQTHNRVYIYDPIQPIQVGLWNSSAGMCFFPGVEDALHEGNRDALLSLVSGKIS